MARRGHERAVLVIGLGRFGGTLAETLQRLDHDVIAVDTDRDLVQEWSAQLTHVVEADATSEAAMRQLGVQDVPRAVVAIGSDIEASLLATGVLLDLGVPEVWAKAITRPHGRILERIGASHVVYPERDAGERVAHVLSGRLIDFIEFDDFAIAKLRAPQDVWEHSLSQSALRSRYGVTIVGVKRPGADFSYAQAETVVRQGDLLIVAGQTRQVERFAAETDG
ncbi:MAG TPA: TrkA family potassium uptake protein [Mycobacteriales bacterium]|nr:TrkA family potassium uptake protein [Mycobacteriales bacterium]